MAKPNLVFIPHRSPGHVVSTLEAAKRILQLPESPFTITVLMIQPRRPSSLSTATSTDIASHLPLPQTQALDIHFHHLPPAQAPDAFDSIEDFVSQYIENNKANVRDALIQISSSAPLVGVVLDFFATTLIDVVAELGVPSYVFFTSSALMLSLMLHLPALHDRIPTDFMEFGGGIVVPGAANPVPSSSMPSPVMDKKKRAYEWFVYHGRRMSECRGIIVNTFTELESRALKAIEDGESAPVRTPPAIYPIGPVITLDRESSFHDNEKHQCIKWLDDQPRGSVVFLCFGSMGGFGGSQVREMARGLEGSGHRFLWCLRSGSIGNLQIPVDAELDEVLPEGFLERTKDRGMVWPSWAPQKEALGHEAVGGFVSHCGWNSTMESLWFGVAMLAWPLYAEQHLNAFEIVKELGVGVELRVKRSEGNYVEGEELERGIRCLMGESEEGKRVRAKAKEMGIESRKALERGGSSYVSLERLVMDLYVEKQS